MTYVPWLSLLTVTPMPVSVLVAVTLTFGSTAPVESWTVPVIVAVSTSALANREVPRHSKAMKSLPFILPLDSHLSALTSQNFQVCANIVILCSFCQDNCSSVSELDWASKCLILAYGSEERHSCWSFQDREQIVSRRLPHRVLLTKEPLTMVCVAERLSSTRFGR